MTRGLNGDDVPSMNKLPYVDQKRAWLAEDIERLFADLPATAGVIFASVQAIPEENGKSSGLRVRLGLKKSLNYDIGAAIVQQVVHTELMKREVKSMYVEMEIYVGSAGKCLGKHSEEANSTETP